MEKCLFCHQEHAPDQPCPKPNARSADADPLIGRIIEGKYVIENLISKGGMASVYMARRRQIGDFIAIKVLKIDEDLDPVDLKRFQLEAAAAASIHHQNIVAIHDFGLLEDIAYIIMERLEGPSLAEEIRRNKTIPLDRALVVFKQVAAAVAAAHKQGLLHRDLKPHNIIFQHPACEDDLVKVVDFGVAKLFRDPRAERLTGTDITVGTPEYMSPEQCFGKALDERSDIYSLGVVLYEMLSGEVPFYNPAPSAILIQHAIEPPRRLNRANPHVPPEVDAVVMKALEKSPEKRPRSAMEMATEFELALRSASANRQWNPSQSHYDDPDFEDTFARKSETKREPLPFSADLVTPTKLKLTVPVKGRRPVHFSFDRFVGRSDELKLLAELCEQSRAGAGKVAFVIGDSGIGKTELVNQFQQKLATASTFILSGRFYEYGGDYSPYRLYLDSLHGFVRNFPLRHSSEWSEERIEKLTGGIREFLAQIDELITFNRRKSATFEEQTKYRAFELLAEIFVLLSEALPVVLFLDDIQWADSLSIEFLAYLIRNTEKNRILILCALRSEDLIEHEEQIRTWLRRIRFYNNYDQINLSPLTEIETRELIHSIFGNIDITESLIRRLYANTGGNPYYLGEVLRRLIQEDKIVWSEGRWRTVDIEEIDLPSTIIDLVELRLKRLTDETIDVFSRAAVMGDRFSYQLLHRIADIPEDALMDIIDVGMREFIIKEWAPPEPSSEDHFIFYHGTLRKILYDRLSPYRRRRLHGQIGERLENLHPRKIDRVASELAYHFHHGAIHRKAFQYCVAAGETARNVFSIEEAVKYYSWAEEAIDRLLGAGEEFDYDPERFCNFRLAYGKGLMHLGKIGLASEQFDLGMKFCQDNDILHFQGKILHACAELSWSRGDYDMALSQCRSALHLLDETGEEKEKCRLLGLIGNIHFSQGAFDKAIELYNESMKQAHTAGDLAGEGEALSNIGMVMAQRNRPQSALEYLDQALTISSAANDRDGERQALMIMGNIHVEQGEHQLAAQYFSQSRAIARAIGKRRGECRVALNMGELYRRKGDFYEAGLYFNEARAIAAEIQDRETEGHAFSNLGLAYQSMGEADLALECFEKALNIFAETNYRSDAEVEALSGIAQIKWAQNDAAEAKRFYEMAVSSGEDLGLWHLTAAGLRCLAECERALGNEEEALARLRDALKAIEKSASSSDSDGDRLQQIKEDILQEIERSKDPD